MSYNTTPSVPSLGEREGMVLARPVRVAADSIIPVFSWLSSAPLHARATSSSIPLLMDFQVLPRLGRCQQCCSEPGGGCVSFRSMLFSRYMCRRGTAGACGSSIFSFLKNLHNIIRGSSPSLHSHQQCRRGSFLSTPSPAFIVCGFFDESHSGRCEVMPYCRFDWHFSTN